MTVSKRGRVGRLLAVALTVAAAGVTGAGVAAAASEGGVFVPGRAEPWTATGVALERGQTFAIRPDGAAITWLRRGMPGSVSGPEGQGAICVAANTTPASACAVEGVAYGTLVARVGQTTMKIGAGGTFIAPEDGWLELAINDNEAFYYDNSGGYAVRVNAAQP